MDQIKATEKEKYFTIKQFCKGIEPLEPHVRKLIKDGHIKTVKGKRNEHLIPQSELERFAREFKV